MEGGWDAAPELISDSKLRRLAITAKNMIDKVGRALVQKGLLPQETYEKNRGQYLPMLYMKYILKHPNGEPLSYLLERKDLDAETRLILGDISELSPEFKIFSALTDTFCVILPCMIFFQTVSKESDWAIKDDDVMVTMDLDNGETMNVSAFWLKEEANRLRGQATYFEKREPQSASDMKKQG